MAAINSDPFQSIFENGENWSTLCLKCPNATRIKAEMDFTLGEPAPYFTIIKHWIAEFKRGRMSCQKERRSGRPNVNIINGNVNPQSDTGQP